MSSHLTKALRSALGGRWPQIVLGLIVATLWPIIVFYRDIQFDPARFAEEWVKGVSLSIVVYIALHVAVRHTSSLEQAERTDKIIESSMIAPLERIQLYLSNSAREQSARITVPVDEWGHFKRSATVTIHQMSALIEPECIPFLNALMTSREVRALEESLTQGSGPKGLSALTVDERATLKNDLKTLIAQLKSSEWRIR